MARDMSLREHRKIGSLNAAIAPSVFDRIVNQCQLYYGSFAEHLLFGTFDSFTALFLALFGLLILFPLSWGIQNICGFFTTGDGYISPVRWLMAVMVPLYISVCGYKRKSLNPSGAFAAYITGFFVMMSSYIFAACLIAFFLICSKATKVNSELKRKTEADFCEGGQRSWMQVLSNGGAAALYAVLYMLEAGCGERAIDFSTSYHASAYSMSVVGALACSCGDTLASELGSVWSTGDPRLVTTFRKVPRGTNGGVSAIGLVVSLFGGIFTGTIFFLTTHLCLGVPAFHTAPPQWPVIVVSGLLGLIGSVLDSYLGAILQYTGEGEDGRIYNHSGPGISKINGFEVLDNHSVNFVSVLASALIAPRISLCIWSFFASF